MYSATQYMESGQSREAMAECLDRLVSQMYADRERPRMVALSTIQRTAGVPRSAEGMMFAKETAETVLQRMTASGRIQGYSIRPRHENGPEYAFIELQRPRVESDA